MTRAYWQDLRDRVIAAVEDEGLSRREAARRDRISDAAAVRWLQALRQGRRSALSHGGDRRSRLLGHRTGLLALIVAEPDLTLLAVAERLLAEHSVKIVHLLRNSMSLASWKDRKPIAQALRSVYRAETAEAGLAALDAFEESQWGKRHPAIAQSWRRHWNQVIAFFAFPEGVRRIIYTTNAIEALNSKLRRAVRTRGHFPGDDAAMKLLYLVLNTAAQEWKRPPRKWSEAKTQFAVIFDERFVI